MVNSDVVYMKAQKGCRFFSYAFCAWQRLTQQRIKFFQRSLGKAVTDTNTVLPYARFASRFDDKWVVSFDVSHPLFANVSYPVSSFMSKAGTDAIIYDTNYSPKVSYQILDTLALGIGFEAPSSCAKYYKLNG